MARPSFEYWNDNASVSGTGEMQEKEHDCDCESARALKKILSLLDDLNNQDLRLLDEIIDRILCERRH